MVDLVMLAANASIITGDPADDGALAAAPATKPGKCPASSPPRQQPSSLWRYPMSTESFKSFMARVSTDTALRESLRAAAPDGMSAEQLAQAGAAHGFNFSASDATGELNETDLEGVAGGGDWRKLGVRGGLNSNSFQEWKWSPVGSSSGLLFKFF
jgi:predicted ribosomally synthesized peptide with nif11-like leader